MKAIITSSDKHEKLNTTHLRKLLDRGKKMHNATGDAVEIDLINQPHRILIEKLTD